MSDFSSSGRSWGRSAATSCRSWDPTCATISRPRIPGCEHPPVSRFPRDRACQSISSGRALLGLRHQDRGAGSDERGHRRLAPTDASRFASRLPIVSPREVAELTLRALVRSDTKRPPPPDPPPRTAPTLASSLGACREDAMICERCNKAEVYRMHAVWRCPECGFKTDCCGW